jgi:hypothetical protein
MMRLGPSLVSIALNRQQRHRPLVTTQMLLISPMMMPSEKPTANEKRRQPRSLRRTEMDTRPRQVLGTPSGPNGATIVLTRYSLLSSTNPRRNFNVLAKFFTLNENFSSLESHRSIAAIRSHQYTIANRALRAHATTM